MSVVYDYEASGNVVQVTDPVGNPYWQRLENDHGLRVKRARFGNGVEQAYQYYDVMLWPIRRKLLEWPGNTEESLRSLDETRRLC